MTQISFHIYGVDEDEINHAGIESSSQIHDLLVENFGWQVTGVAMEIHHE